MQKQKLTIDSVESLEQFKSKVFSNSRRAFKQIEFAMPSNSKTINQIISTTLNDLYFACGCAEATISGSIGIVGYFVWRTPFTPRELDVLDLGIILLVFTCFSIVGKSVGLRRARNKLITEIESLVRQYNFGEKVSVNVKVPPSQV